MTAADAYDDLRRLLNEWDPIGVAEDVDDEYDCLIVPIINRLRGDAGRSEIRAFLRAELTEHFGLSKPYGVDGAADRLTAWWTSAQAQDA